MTHQQIIPGGTICILGAGQLGKMSLQAAHRLGYHTMIWAPEGDIPAMEMATHRLVCPYDNKTTIDEVLRNADVITTEWENIPLSLIKELERRGGVVRPGSKVLEVAQSRWAEKKMARSLGVNTTPTLFWPADTSDPNQDWISCLPGILKTDGLGYDGKGQYAVETVPELVNAHQKAGVDCVLEKRVELLCELSVLVARSSDGSISVSEVVENTHKKGILDITVYSTKTGDMMLMRERRAQVQEIAFTVADELELEGVLCLEFFVDTDYNLLFNEMAPRPHNSFHGSIEAAYTSQFEQHIRAICGLPLGNVEFHTPFEMQNLIGGTWEGDWAPALNDPSSRLHLYGKQESRPGRKMGHVTRLISQA